MLLDHGADPNSTAENGATPLHVAAVTGNVLTVQRLLRCPDIRVDALMPGSGFSALHLGVASADVATITALLDHHAAFDETGCSGVTPVHIAAHLGLPGILQQLLTLESTSHHGSMSTPKHGSMSPLIFTCCAPREDVVKPALHVLTCVDWLGHIPLKPFLLRALMLSAEDRQLSDFVPPHSLHSSYVASSTRTLQNAIKQKLETFELPSDSEDPAVAMAGKQPHKSERGIQVCARTVDTHCMTPSQTRCLPRSYHAIW